MPGLEVALSIVGRYDTFLILCHEDPDGDALGASLALQAGLEQIGKIVTVACRDQPAPPFQFLSGIDRISHDFIAGDYQALVIVDCGDLFRTGYAGRISQFHQRKRPIINIDHHPKNDLHKIALVNLVNPNVAASVQIIAELLAALGVTITPEMATQLLTGLYTDTGGFKHSNTTPAVLKLASSLLGSGARLKKIVRNIAATKSLTALRLWGIALSRVRKHPHLPLVVSVVREEDLKLCQGNPEDLGGVVNMINSIPGTQVAILFTELPGGEIKVSLRTETEGIDLSRIAGIFGGGGHKKASGFRLKGQVVDQGGQWRIVAGDRGRVVEDELLGTISSSVVNSKSPVLGQVTEW